MNRHATTEQLSAYLDRELGAVELRQLEAHYASCEECSARLASMRRVVRGLDSIGRAVPPPALRQQIRRQVMTQAMMPPTGLRAVFERFCLHLLPPQPSVRTAAVMGLALVVGLFVYNHIPTGPVEPQEDVIAGAYDDTPISSPITTSKVAGREFIWTDSGWIQRGLEGKAPEVHVEAGSPQGKALLNKYSGLEWLLADGSPVLLRYNLGTVEIRPKSPTRVLGYEREVQAGQVLEA
ncbi:MAG TPA: zf-HC2 domain-containing protein [Thermoanaerobaculia bacterium]